MKKHEEIKKAHEYCLTGHCPRKECPYYGLVPSCAYQLQRDSLAYIQQLEAQVPKWISVEDTEHKPMHGKDYLCVCTLKDYPDERWLQVLRWYADENGNGYVQRPHFTDEGCCGMLVTHWSEKPEMPPLPEAPKEEHE